MLTGIGLRNFKAFGDEMQEAPLSKITLIYGPNSGGKSSIIQALLLLKQSLKVADSGLALRGEFVDLGSSHALLHKHEVERDLGISIKYRNLELVYDVAENGVILTYSSSGKLSNVRHRIISSENKRLLLDATAIRQPEEFATGLPFPFYWQGNVKLFDPNGDDVIESNGVVFLSSELLVASESFPLPALALPGMNGTRKQVQKRAWSTPQAYPKVSLSWTNRLQRAEKLARELEQNLDGMGWEWDLVQELGLELELAQTLELIQERAQEKARVLDNLISELDLSDKHILDLTPENIPADYEHHMRSINYLAPLRSPPERLYPLSSEIDSSPSITTGIQGEFSASVLYHKQKIKESVNDWFERLEIPYELDVIKIGEPSLAGEHITIALTDKRTDTKVTLADVGYGINQILPVIIEGIASQEGAILCVEQPEIHLHPRLQANIADLMIDTIADEPGKRKQWIVETHSELLITRLQRRIREGKISPDDISVLYVDPSDDNGAAFYAIIV
ncbi:MAG: AAA family ATPase, partial [Chloroflexi bacterium]|nr:AAA family ATPase [Chloroflexota bacterium]